MTYLTRITIASAVVWLMCAGNAAAHPFHVSFAEVDWNPKSGKLEVALKIDPDDLEQAVRLHCGKRINIDQKSSAAVIADYVQANFTIRPPRLKTAEGKKAEEGKSSVRLSAQKPSRIDFKWVGSELSVKSAWLYFEIASERQPDGFIVANTLLSHTHHPTNTVLVRAGRKAATMTFNSQTTRQAVRLEAKSSQKRFAP